MFSRCLVLKHPRHLRASLTARDCHTHIRQLHGAESFSKIYSHSVSREVPVLLWNPKVHYCVHKTPSLVPTLSQLNLVGILPPLLSIFILILSSRDSSVGIATGWTAGVRFPAGADFLFSVASLPALGPTQPLIQWVPREISTRVKRWGREADHSTPSSAEVKNVGAIPPLPHMSSWHSG
jgi:hypothetical protein